MRRNPNLCRAAGVRRSVPGPVVVLLVLPLVLLGLTAPAPDAWAQCGDAGDPARTGGSGPADLSKKVDLNSASLETILALPISEDVARAIVDYRDYVRYYEDIYEVLEVEGVTPQILAALKPLVQTLPPKVADKSLARLSASYRQMQRYLGQEGSSEGLADEYLDKMRNPENINEMDLYDLMSYQNVSPVDATNIIKARDRLGAFETSRQLRRSEGLRYWAFRNVRDFVVYSEDELEELSSGPRRGVPADQVHRESLLLAG